MNETLPRHWLGARKGIERLRTKDQDSHRCTHNTTHNLLLSCPFASLFLLAPKYQSTMSAKPEVDTKMKTADSAEKTNQEGDEAQKLALEALEEDDEFEEFDPAHWNADAMEEEVQQQWMENWDDDMANAGDFLSSLRQELQKNGK